MVNNLSEDLKRKEAEHPNRTIRASIPIPPSKNHAFIYRGYKKIPKQTTRKYKEQVSSTICKMLKEKKWNIEDKGVWYYMDLYFYMPDKRRRDSHNSIEVLMDTLEGCLFEDDYYVMPRIQHVGLDREKPRLEFEFFPIEAN